MERAISEDFPGGLSGANFEKLMALRVMHHDVSFWLSWESNLWCSMGLSGTSPNFDVLQAPTVAQIYNAAYIAERIRTDLPYSSEVAAFLGAVHRHDEVLLAQKPLELVDVTLEGTPPVDLKSVRAAWPEVLSSGKAPTEHTPEAEQLRRMLQIHQGLEESKDAARKQLLEVVGDASIAG